MAVKKWSTRSLLLLSALILLFLAAAVVFLLQLQAYRSSAELYDQAAELVLEQEPERSAAETEAPARAPTYLEIMAAMDFTQLQAINSEVIGWISIPETAVHYPLLQAADNEKYLSYTYTLSYSAAGSIFMDFRNASDLSDFNTILYGHRMHDGSMFYCLNKYRTQEFADEHPYIYLATESGAYQYQVFSAYIGSASVDAESYALQFDSAAEQQDFLDAACAATEVVCGITPDTSSTVITLSTCTGNGHANRMKVHAVLVDFLASEPDQPLP